MEEYITFTKKCFNNYLKKILGKQYNKEIVEEFLDTYITVRYSNYLDEASNKLSLVQKISKAIEDKKKELIKNDSDLKENIENTALFVDYFYYLDQLYILESQKKTIDDILELRKKVLDLKDDFNSQFFINLRDDTKKKKDFLMSFESDVFCIL